MSVFGVAQFCLNPECGEIILSGSRCEDCQRAYNRAHDTNDKPSKRNRADRFGPRNTAWKRLAAKAKRLQPFCSDCHDSKAQIEARGDRLETDHLFTAYLKEQQHRSLTLSDVDVVCGKCNRARGAAKDRDN